MSKLNKYSAKVAVLNVDESKEPNLIKNFTEVIRARPHLRLLTISYNFVLKQVTTDIEFESLNKDIASKVAAEELFEIANAILLNIQGVSIKVLELMEN